MRTLRFLLQKEFRQIFRNKTLLRSMIMAPMIQLIILPQAANYEVKNISLAVVDHDKSTYSQQMINKITSSGYFILREYTNSYDQALTLLERDKADIILEIPPRFEKNLIRENQQKIFMAVNAVNGIKALVGSSYIGGIVRDFNRDIVWQWAQPERFNAAPTIEVTSSNWFNPLMSYKVFMVPGILVLLVTMIGSMMCALNIVKEKEIGTIEQINVTPVKKYHFILGKLIPFWVMGMVIFTLGSLLGRFVYGIQPVGNPLLLYAFLALYLVAILGLGLLISTYSANQQQAMSLSFFFIMIFNLMSGLFTPIDSMPDWAQVIARLNPISYFIDVMRMVVLKGSTGYDILPQIGAIAIFAVVFNVWAILNYRKTA